MEKVFAVLFIGISLYIVSCVAENTKTSIKPEDKVYTYYLNTIDSAILSTNKLISAVKQENKADILQKLFLDARLAFKNGEFLTAYYTPLSNKMINGAPIPLQDEDDQHRLTQPEGFQVIEPYLFPDFDAGQKENLLRELGILLVNFKHLKQVAESQQLAATQIFDALKLETFRIITLGLSGFDSPVAQYSIREAHASLEGLQRVVAIYQQDNPQKSLSALAKKIKLAQLYLNKNTGFNEFNRAIFITKHLNPLSANIEIVKKDLKIKPVGIKRFLAEDAENLFAQNVFDADYFSVGDEAKSNPSKVELGAYLFYDPILSGNKQRACASCHRPDKAFTDGLAKSPTLKGDGEIKRNTPTVLNAGLQYGQFYDNRVIYLEDQATDVISNQDEMHGHLDDALAALKNSKSYGNLFKKAFKGDDNPVNSFNLRNALACYIRSLQSLNSPFDKFMRGQENQLTKNEINGFNLFMGKGKCGTCHFTPLFNGTVPPDFITAEVEIIGVPVKPGVKRVDPDKGRYQIRKIKLHEFAFKVPTVRNIALTGPYMHNGSFNTLEEVIDFYNEGGGTGLELNLENQTLPFDKLNLSSQEKKDIIAFLHKLTDTSAVKKTFKALPALRTGESRLVSY